MSVPGGLEWLFLIRWALLRKAYPRYSGRTSGDTRELTQCVPPAPWAASSCFHARGSGTLVSQPLQRVEKMLDSAMGKQPAPLPLLTRLASLRNLQGRYAETEALYRQILQRDSRNIMVMNNLAYLLASRAEKTAEAMSLINRAIDPNAPFDR